MKIPRHRYGRDSLDGESMTPMIDVVFLLLIFFVVASIGQTPDQLLPASIGPGNTETDLPRDITSTELPVQEVLVRMSRQLSGELTVTLNDRPVTTTELRQSLKTLAELDPRTKVILDPADEVLVQQFITIYEYCQNLSFESISLAVHEKH
ncbi:MAG: biopolymer transporter ExbD [Planctomycetaceae bacterium]